MKLFHFARALTLGLFFAPGALAQEYLEVSAPGAGSAFSSNGLFSGYGSGGGFKIWSLGQGSTFIADPGTAGTEVTAISDDGKVVAGRRVGEGSFLWSEANGFLPVPGAVERRIAGLSADGRVALTWVPALPPESNFFTLWTPGGGTVVVDPYPGTLTTNLRLSKDGKSLVGTSQVASTGVRAATIWDSQGNPSLLDPLGLAGPDSQGLGISSDGTWVVGSRMVAGQHVAFRWSAATGFLALPAVSGVPAGAPTLGRFVSDDGLRVAGGFYNPGGSVVWAVWDIGGASLKARDFMQAAGAPDPGFGWQVFGVSSNGERWLFTKSNNPAMWVDFNAEVSTSYCPGVINSTGMAGKLTALGSPDLGDAALFLRADDLPKSQAVLPLVSQTQGFLPMAGGSQGNLCLAGAVGRFPVGQSSLGGRYQVQLDLSSIPTPSGPTAMLAGQTWNFQAWYRDQGGQSNFTNGATVTF